MTVEYLDLVDYLAIAAEITGLDEQASRADSNSDLLSSRQNRQAHEGRGTRPISRLRGVS